MDRGVAAIVGTAGDVVGIEREEQIVGGVAVVEIRRQGHDGAGHGIAVGVGQVACRCGERAGHPFVHHEPVIDRSVECRLEDVLEAVVVRVRRVACHGGDAQPVLGKVIRTVVVGVPVTPVARAVAVTVHRS